jgi:hypothetical protein
LRFALTTRYQRKKAFYRSFAAGVRKLTRVKRKMKREKKEAFTDLIVCATS